MSDGQAPAGVSLSTRTGSVPGLMVDKKLLMSGLPNAEGVASLGWGQLPPCPALWDHMLDPWLQANPYGPSSDPHEAGKLN